MKRAYVFDADGNEVDDRVCPPGGRVVVPFRFMDARSAHVQRAFGDGLLHAPGWAAAALGDVEATTSNQRSQSAAEAREAYVRRLSSAWQVMPRTATKPRPGLAAYEPDDAAQDGDASERAYERLKACLSDAWKTPVADNEVEGMATPDLPDDIAAMPLTAQHAYCAGYNKFMEEHPEADDEQCDQAGREAIAALGSQDSSVFEAIRTDAQRRYAERITNAWKT